MNARGLWMAALVNAAGWIAGISSFGIGGTNSHVIIEEPVGR